MENKIEFEKMFDYGNPVDHDAEQGELIKISNWAKNVLKDGYFDKLTRGHSSDILAAFIESNADIDVTSHQMKGAIKMLKALSREIERLSNLM